MSAANTMEIEVLVKVDADGQYEIGVDADDLAKRWEETVGELAADVPTRVVRVTVRVPLPKAVEVRVEIPDEPQDAAVGVN